MNQVLYAHYRKTDNTIFYVGIGTLIDLFQKIEVNISALSSLIKGKVKTHAGWRVVNKVQVTK